MENLASQTAQGPNQLGALRAFFDQGPRAPSLSADEFIDAFLSQVRDVSLRDGHQSLDGNRWRIEERLPVAALIDRLGLHSVESGGGADFDVATMLGENPFENLRRFGRAFLRTPQQWLFRGRNALGLGPQPRDVIEAMVAHAVRHGLKGIRVFDGMNDASNIRSTVEAAKKAGASVEGAIAYTVDPRDVPAQEKAWSIPVFVEQAKAMRDMGVDAIAIKDMAGLLTEEAVSELVARLHREVGLPIAVHSHASTGRATGVLLQALETARRVGARIVIDTAIGDLSGGTSHPDLREVLRLSLKRAGFKPEEYRDNPKLKLLEEIESLIARTAARFKSGRVKVDAQMSALLDASGVPGGMVGTTAKMIGPAELKDFQRRLNRPDLTVNDIIKEGLRRVPTVREDAGLPPLVTPMSQFVLMQAIFNFLEGDYVKIHPQLSAMMKGRFGKVRGPQSRELLARLPGEAGPPAPLPPTMPSLIEEARRLAFEHALDIPDPVEAALLLVARKGRDVLLAPRASWFKVVGRREDGFPIVESLARARTRREIEHALGGLPRAIAADKLAGRNPSPLMAEALRRLDELGLAGRARVGGRLILEEFIELETSDLRARPVAR